VRQVRGVVLLLLLLLLGSTGANKLLSSQSRRRRENATQRFKDNRGLTCPALSCRDQSELDGNASVAG
jgi:hypothetical protein